MEIFCDPCLSGDKKIKATHYCKSCEAPEPMCNDCAIQHTRQKSTRDHKLCDDIRKCTANQKDLITNVNQTDQEEVLCDTCLFRDIKTKATHYCQSCDTSEPMCNDCAIEHTRQLSTKDHKLCDDIQKFTANQKDLSSNVNQTDQEEVLCDTCLFEDIKTKATHYCQSCDAPEPMCNDCAIKHTRQLSTKDHKLCNDIRKFTANQKDLITNAGKTDQEEVLCDTCLFGDKKTKATHYCKSCDAPEPLCNDCAIQHTRQKSTRNHKLCDDIREFTAYQKDLSANANQRDQEEVLCDTCLFGDIKTKATHYCKSCDAPDPLCNNCAIQHTRQKSTRNHKLCDDIREFTAYQKDLSSNADQSDQMEVLCDTCLFGDIKTKATHYCKSCDAPEPLCNNCAIQHTRQKSTRNHKLCDDIREFTAYQKDLSSNADQTDQIKVLCDTCLFGNKETKATHYCKSCDAPEPLCNDCAIQHTRQKSFRGHKVCDDIHKFTAYQEDLSANDDKTNEEDILCVPCLYGNLCNKATHFCTTCTLPEPFCKDCAQHHTRQKLSRDHNLCDEMRTFCILMKTFMSKCSAKTDRGYDDRIPGKPQPTDIKSDSVTCTWGKSSGNISQYQIRYKTIEEHSKWKLTETDSNDNHITISGLMANTKYIFQVRGIFGDEEGPFGQVNDNIKTNKSLASLLVNSSQPQNKTKSPTIHLLPVVENENARNQDARTRQLILGLRSSDYIDEKTIMLVGATGSGKSTLVDGIVNYITGVSFEDPFRFTIVTLEEEEKKTENQAISQTEWITVYKIYPTEGSRLSYTLNIIDTPGFGDTRGIERDNAIVDQISHLFSAKGNQGVLYIDAVCFIVKAPDARLTVQQKYIFSSIMSLFGKDIESNICTLITFADGAKPPVLSSLKESQLPFGLTFNFNNSALFAENKDLVHTTLSPMFWQMGCKSFEKLFAHISKLQTRSLRQTKNVLDEREQLKTVLSCIRPQVTAGLSVLSELQQQLNIFTKYKNEIDDNQKFEYEVEETRQELKSLPPGQHVTNCLQCNITCHEDCKIADDEKKRRCWAIDRKTGHCRICIGKCIWSDHKNTPYIFTYVTETVKKTYAEMKERYEKAVGQNLSHEKLIENLTNRVENLFENITAMMNQMNQCKTRLKEIALRPDPLSAIEHIDLMIQSEEIEKQPGFFNRIKMLKDIKTLALVDQDVENLGQNIRITREKIKSIMGKRFPTRTCKKKPSLATGNPVPNKRRFLKRPWYLRKDRHGKKNV